MANFGWYYESGSVQDESADLWTLLERAIPEAIDDGRLHALRVGEMHECSASELFDAEDVISMSDEGQLTAETIVEVISERHGERAYDGLATMDNAVAKPALRRIVQAHRCAEDAAPDVVRWADEHVALDPYIVCLGREPLPIEYVEGEWRFGCRDAEPPEPAAVIAYTTEPSPETGHVGWCWWALGRMGDSETLREAMAACESVIQEALNG